ncbi:MAG: hypothetical protein CMJ64_04980 [Planctomycetaceae bacterium]|nr:hypothetical protein [Planctomycetaceae bacterium]
MRHTRQRQIRQGGPRPGRTTTEHGKEDQAGAAKSHEVEITIDDRKEMGGGGYTKRSDGVNAGVCASKTVAIR